MKYAPGKNPNSHIRSKKTKEKTSKTLRKMHKEKSWGFTPGFSPWNKGIIGYRAGIPRHNYNQEFRKKISKYFKTYYKTNKPWNEGLNKDNDERLSKISIKMKAKMKAINPMARLKIRKKISMISQGKNEKEWEGFLNYKNNRTAKYLSLREKILKRDNYLCICKKKGNQIHHIDYDNFNDIPNNVITLCKRCHTKTNWNRKYWKKFLTKHLNRKYDKI